MGRAADQPSPPSVNISMRVRWDYPGAWDDNIKMDLREVGWAGMEWTDLAQDTDKWRANRDLKLSPRWM
jgi:hypothetical protein